MSVPPPPQHPPPRRQPHTPEDPSLTTQIFIGQARAATGRAEAGQTDATPGSSGGADPLAQNPPAAHPGPQETGGREAAASQRPAVEDEGESTQMLSMEELRQLAAASRIEALDGPREDPGAAARGPVAGAADEARAQEQAPPGVFSPHVPPSSGQSVPAAPLAAPPAAPPPVQPHTRPAHAVPAGYPAQSAHAAPVQGGHPSPPAKPTAPPPAAGAGYASEGPPAAPQRRRRMPMLAIAFVVLSALVVVGIGGWILVDALTRDTGQSQQAAPPPPATDDSTGEGGLVDDSDDGTAAPATAESFATPSGNIGCTIDEERARCVVKSFDYSPPDAPDGCEMGEWGSIVVANRDGAGFSCTPAEFPEDAEPLDYGQTITAHGMTCSSSESGVSCRSEETGAAFSVARAEATFDQAG